MKVVGLFVALIALGLFAAVVLSTLTVVFIIAVVGSIVSIKNPFERQGGESLRALISHGGAARLGQTQESRG